MEYSIEMESKVLYVCSGRSFNSAQPGRKISSIVQCWQKLGNSVTLLCGDDFVGNAGTPLVEGQQNSATTWLKSAWLARPLVHSLSERLDLAHDGVLRTVIRKRVRDSRPAVIWERSCRLHKAALDVARENGISYVLEWKDHLVDYRFSLFRGKALRMEARKNREAGTIVVESGVLRDELGRGGVDTDKIIVAYNAVQADQFTRDELKRARARKELGVGDETVLVGYLGSYAFYHDAARLVLAADIVRKSDVAGKIKIVMVGAGKEYPSTRKIAESLGLLDNVLMMKPGVSKDEVPSILAALDIAVLPGSTDIICPIKIQEYMACELPSVVPDYACNREVLRDGETGAFFKPKDEAALAKKIIHLAGHRELREGMGRRAREEAIRRFSWEATWGAALETVLERERVKSFALTERVPE